MNYRIELKVKDLLEQNHITQKRLAEIANMRESTISDIVRGTRTVINFEHLSRIAEALDIQDISQLIDFVAPQGAEGYSWEKDILSCIEALGKREFCLQELYGYIDELQTKHPTNHSVDAKIRQMLQVLRKKGIISFVDGNGHYRLNQPQDERSALTSASSLRSPYPTNKSPFPAHSTGKGGFLIHPQNFSCSPLTIPLS